MRSPSGLFLLLLALLQAIRPAVAANYYNNYYNSSSNSNTDDDLVDLSNEDFQEFTIRDISEIMLPYNEGKCPVRICYSNPKALCEIALDKKWLVSPKDELLQRLKEMVGSEMVHLRF